MPPPVLTRKSLTLACEELSERDPILGRSYKLYGKPPMWSREPGFATLLQIILEQQVSLASAKACFDRLVARVGVVTPETLLNSTDVELRVDGFSRQKTTYARYLAESLVNKDIDLDVLHMMDDIGVGNELMRMKGIGRWTADIYLLMALRRPDIMPKGDIALHTAWHKLSGDARPSADEFLVIAERWRPFRSVAARMLWHFYLSERSRKGRSER
jgi:DNA-3-methyladenine glycosylase II